MKKKSNIRDICMIGLFTAIIAILAQISIPLPLGVPLTMQTFAIALAGVILGGKRGGLATLIYVLLGAIGVPVFANLSGGFQNIVGPTGGFIISFPIMALLIGIGADYYHKNKIIFVIMIILGFVVNYTVGVGMFCLVTGSSVSAGLAACVIPFLITDFIKIVLAPLLGIRIRKLLPAEMVSACA